MSASGLISNGKKTEKHVPECKACVLVRSRIIPSYFRRMSDVTQRPSPVPLSPLVVKNGSKMLVRTLAGMPGPSSATTTRSPGRSRRQSQEAYARSVIVPCRRPIASIALPTRLANICRSSPGNARMWPSKSIEDSGAPIRNREGQIEGVVLVFHDVSEQKKVEKASRSSDRLATTGRLAATIAHEIHNPLDAVGGLLYLIGQSTNEDTTREYVSMASQELVRTTQMTQQMLAFQREAAKPIPVRIGTRIMPTVREFRNRMSARTEKAFGVSLLHTEIRIETPTVQSPDANVGKVFDRNWELLSSVIPMWLDRAFAGGRVNYELKVPVRQGEGDEGRNRFYAITYEPLRGNGEGSRVIVVVVEITERKMAEEQLQKLNRTLKALSNSNHALLHASSESEFLQQVCCNCHCCPYAGTWLGLRR